MKKISLVLIVVLSPCLLGNTQNKRARVRIAVLPFEDILGSQAWMNSHLGSISIRCKGPNVLPMGLDKDQCGGKDAKRPMKGSIMEK